MSERDDSRGGGYEPMTRPAPGAGLLATGRCDECQCNAKMGRARAKVKKGPLRGLVGMVCGGCMALREKAPA